jgi:ABC-type polysaccharide/polyol phosphate transport system ATPase subunit
MRSATTVDDSSAPEADHSPAPVVIEARGVAKSFRIPSHRVDSLKERVTRPFAPVEYRTHRAVDAISFDVRQGEFFGIVGRNGSGKSTLLKILASIYRADAGTIRTAGRVAPFIELGVGFNPELTARENGVLNGVLMGLTMREARRRLDAMLEFAELEDFVDLKLKNYSSGMMVRLAFAVMVQADADIMLVDEVLAVGDAAFAQKCMDVFHERRRAGRTIVLVTHDMTTVQSLCDRAMLLHDGKLEFVGAPEEAALRYLRLNFGGRHAVPALGGGDIADTAHPVAAVPEFNVRKLEARLLDAGHEPVANVELGRPLEIDVALAAARALDRPSFVLNVLDEDGTVVFGVTRMLDRPVPEGGTIRLSGAVDNVLVPGRYFLDCWVRSDPDRGPVAVQGLRLLQFVVYGTGAPVGLVSVRADIEPVLEGER